MTSFAPYAQSNNFTQGNMYYEPIHSSMQQWHMDNNSPHTVASRDGMQTQQHSYNTCQQSTTPPTAYTPSSYSTGCISTDGDCLDFASISEDLNDILELTNVQELQQQNIAQNSSCFNTPQNHCWATSPIDIGSSFPSNFGQRCRSHDGYNYDMNNEHDLSIYPSNSNNVNNYTYSPEQHIEQTSSLHVSDFTPPLQTDFLTNPSYHEQAFSLFHEPKKLKNSEACKISRIRRKEEKLKREKMMRELSDENGNLRLQILSMETEVNRVREYVMRRLSGSEV